MVKALVIGVGGFGKYHAKNLVQLGLYDEIIVTRRDACIAAASAAEFQKIAVPGVKVISEKVADIHDLDLLLSENRDIEFATIAARCQKDGDDIHLDYMEELLRRDINVFTEKPVANAYEDGRNVSRFQMMTIQSNPNDISEHLPMKGITEHDVILEQLKEAITLRFLWATLGLNKDGSVRQDVIDNLILHPWSAIPDGYSVLKVETEYDKGSSARVAMDIFVCGRPNIEGIIDLRYGSDFSGFEIICKDRTYTYAIKKDDLVNDLIPLEVSLEEAVKIENSKIMGGEPLLTIDNPLRQQLIAAYKGKPVANRDVALNSQLFLAKVKGYKS